MPKRVKHRKFMRRKLSGDATSVNYVSFGDFGIDLWDQPGLFPHYTNLES